MNESEPHGNDMLMDLDTVRNEFGVLHLRLCSALSTVTALQRQKDLLAAQLVKATARIAEMEREHTAGDGHKE